MSAKLPVSYHTRNLEGSCDGFGEWNGRSYVQLTHITQTYERVAIETWFASNDTDPLTQKTLASRKIVPVLVLKNAITEWKEMRKKQLEQQPKSSD